MIRGGAKEKMVQGVFGGFEPFKKQIILQNLQTKHSEASQKVILDWGAIKSLQVLELEEDSREGKLQKVRKKEKRNPQSQLELSHS